MLLIGLTGGIASGKNLVAKQLRQLKIPVFDADLEVHRLLREDQKVFRQIQLYFPKAIINNNISRLKLGELVFNNRKQLDLLENIIYLPLRQKEKKFIASCKASRKKLAVLNIPLLFEKGGYKKCHKNIVVISPEFIRRQRFFSRNQDQGASPEKWRNIIKNQINEQKRKKLADFIICNGLNEAFTLRQTKVILSKLNYL